MQGKQLVQCIGKKVLFDQQEVKGPSTTNAPGLASSGTLAKQILRVCFHMYEESMRVLADHFAWVHKIQQRRQSQEVTDAFTLGIALPTPATLCGQTVPHHHVMHYHAA